MKSVQCRIVAVACLALSIFLGSCKKEAPTAINAEEIRSICNLAVMECYYHNRAESTRVDKIAFGLGGTKERSFWTEYTAKIKVGVDASQIVIDVEGTTVTIKLPKPKNLSKPNILEDTITTFSSEGGKTKITGNERLQAKNDANKNMVTELLENSTLMRNAEERVKEILKSYIEQMGKLSGVEYTIKWESLS